MVIRWLHTIYVALIRQHSNSKYRQDITVAEKSITEASKSRTKAVAASNNSSKPVAASNNSSKAVKAANTSFKAEPISSANASINRPKAVKNPKTTISNDRDVYFLFAR